MSAEKVFRTRIKCWTRRPVGDRVVETRHTEAGRTVIDVSAEFVPRPPAPSPGRSRAAAAP